MQRLRKECAAALLLQKEGRLPNCPIKFDCDGKGCPLLERRGITEKSPVDELELRHELAVYAFLRRN